MSKDKTTPPGSKPSDKKSDKAGDQTQPEPNTKASKKPQKLPANDPKKSDPVALKAVADSPQEKSDKNAEQSKPAIEKIGPVDSKSENDKQPPADAQTTKTANQSKDNEKAAEAEKDSALFNAAPMPKLDKPVPGKSHASGGNKKGLAVAALLLSLITLGGAGYVGYQQYLMQGSMQQAQTSMQEQLTTQDASNRNVAAAAQSSMQATSQNQQVIRQQAELIGQLRESLLATQARIKELSGRRAQDWMLAEAEYLIKLAEYKVTLEKDKQTAIGLLKTADEKVMEIGDSSLLELRQSIAQDIANLQLVVAPDNAGIAVQIQALIQQIPQLNIVAMEFSEAEAGAESIELAEEQVQDEGFQWRAVYQNFLDDFVVIKDHSEPLKPLMTMEQRGNLNANVQLSLQQAQIAMARADQAMYEIQLEQASAWIQEFFKQEESTQAVLQSIDGLRQTRIVIDLPAALSSRQQIQAINQERLYQWLEQPNSNGSNNSSLELQQ